MHSSFVTKIWSPCVNIFQCFISLCTAALVLQIIHRLNKDVNKSMYPLGIFRHLTLCDQFLSLDKVQTLASLSRTRYKAAVS